MDSVFGICGKDWCIVVADTNVNRSIFALKSDEDKIMQMNKSKVCAASGEQTERYQFTNYIMRNLNLMEMQTGFEPGVEQTAQYMRSEMAEALRRAPYQVNVLLGGYDHVEEEAQMYYLDYLGCLQRVSKGAHGYAAYFVNSVLDQHFKKDMTLEQGMEAMRQCIVELRTRFIMNQPVYLAKIVTKDGIKVETLK
jgi:20S proteasome subunit beta 4|tara:strand:+ start:75 stop:659 length:585 start_codon:yes stop_codon:yes gene_type:complete